MTATATQSTLLRLRLAQTRYEGQGIVSLTLVSPEGHALPAFTAGAHIDLLLPENRIRSYSLLNDPAETHRYVVAVQHDLNGRGGSRWLHTVPRVGELLEVMPPVNHFPLCESAPQTVLLAGGIGITPLISMAHRLSQSGRPWHLVYAVRQAAQAVRLEALRRLADSGNGTLTVWLDEVEGKALDLPAVLTGVASDAHVYCCGPKGMIDAYLAAGQQVGIAPERLHYERFAASAAVADAGGYDVVLQRSGQRFPIPQGKTILDVLLDHGVPVQYACSAGICGTCRVGVVEGEPDHRDDYLTEAERAANDCVMVCCSGARSSTLVLDL